LIHIAELSLQGKNWLYLQAILNAMAMKKHTHCQHKTS